MMSMATKKKGFTIVELLTVMSIIIILISVLVPALNKVRVFAKVVTQKGQFHEISNGLELYRNDHQETYPDSGPADGDGRGYCGAMKLCEAMMGQDGMGFNPRSRFWADGTAVDPNGSTRYLYYFNLCSPTSPPYTGAQQTNMRERTKYLESDNVTSNRLQDLYNWALSTAGTSYGLLDAAVTFEDDPDAYPNAVISDVFLRGRINSTLASCPSRAGETAGMPVLYYKPNPTNLSHDPNDWSNSNVDNIYNFDDNYAITAMGCSWENTYITDQPMYLNPGLFYEEITNERVTSAPRPHNVDGYILMSAGYDGLYGTRDDVFNFAD